MLQNQHSKSAHSPPGPHGPKLIGSLLDFLRHPIDFVMHAGTFGDLAHFRLGPHSAYLVKSPEYLHEIFVKQPARISRHQLSKQAARKFVGDALALLDGERHRQDRKLIMQAFHPRRMQAYAAIMIDETQRMVASWRGKAQISLDIEMQTLALNIACRTLFGADVSGQSAPVIRAMADFQEVLAIEARNFVPLPDWLPLPHKLRMRRSIATLHGFIRKIIRAHRERPADNGALLSMMLRAVDDETGQGMSEQQVQDHIIFLFVAGHETTSGLLSWVPYLLERYPAVDAAVTRELDEALGERPLTWADLPRLSYLEQVSKEALRLYPSAWLLARTVIADLTLGPYTIPRGSSLFLSPYVTQRDAAYFSEPLRFQPERFAPGAEKAIPRYAYFPFGGGVTSCIGAQFAMMTAKIVLATMLRNYRLTSVTDEEILPAGLITLRPGKQMRMNVQPLCGA